MIGLSILTQMISLLSTLLVKNEKHPWIHSFGGLTVKDAVVDCFRDAGLDRPSVEKYQPDIRIQARLVRNQIHFFVDFSGRSLFQRGYREGTGAAPIKEKLSCGINYSLWLVS